MRLFVALQLPRTVVQALCSVELPQAPGMRRIRPEQMHLTLHFVGDADAAVVRAALETVSGRRCRIAVRGVGRFRAEAGRQILWAGVVGSEALLELHAACGRALGEAGIRIERRRFRPHVTVARLQRPVAGAAVEAFLRSGRDREFGSFVARQFVLFNSVTAEDGARYERVASFPLS